MNRESAKTDLRGSVINSKNSWIDNFPTLFRISQLYW